MFVYLSSIRKQTHRAVFIKDSLADSKWEREKKKLFDRKQCFIFLFTFSLNRKQYQICNKFLSPKLGKKKFFFSLSFVVIIFVFSRFFSCIRLIGIHTIFSSLNWSRIMRSRLIFYCLYLISIMLVIGRLDTITKCNKSSNNMLKTVSFMSFYVHVAHIQIRLEF